MGTTYLRIVSWHGVCYSDYQDSLRHWRDELECLFLMIFTDIHCTFLPKTSWLAAEIWQIEVAHGISQPAG